MRIVVVFVLLSIGIGALKAQSLGFSGMEKISDSKFLVVYDKKTFHDGDRVAILKVDKKDGYSVDELKIKNWKHDDGKANDLESVCAVPDTKDEFLLVESGYGEGGFGRIFHVELEDEKLKVKKVYKLPSISPAGKDNPDGDNFEGVVCVKNKGKLYVLVGERGGTERIPNGLLRIGMLKKGEDKIDWKTYADNTIEIKAPKIKNDNRAVRSITDLHMDKNGVLYASAAVDAGDMGPFTSFVSEIGEMSFKNDELKFTRSKNKKPLAIVDGFKIEALSSAPSFMEDCNLCIGTEDEVYPGQWRPLFLGN